MRCGASLSKGFTMSMLNTDYICPECKSVERHSKYYSKAAEAEKQAYKAGNRNFKGLYGDVKPKVYPDSLNAKEYSKRIIDTYTYICNKFNNNQQNFYNYIQREYNMSVGEFITEAFNNTETFRKCCMRLAGESVGQKTTACHSYAGSVCAVMRLLDMRCKVYIGLALRRDTKRYREEKLGAICSNKVMCNHCWVFCASNAKTYDYFNGYNQNIDYVAWMEVS